MGEKYPDGAYFDFNSHAREGRDTAGAAVVSAEKSFQLTRPRGARHAVQQIFEKSVSISTHTPARGAT